MSHTWITSTAYLLYFFNFKTIQLNDYITLNSEHWWLCYNVAGLGWSGLVWALVTVHWPRLALWRSLSFSMGIDLTTDPVAMKHQQCFCDTHGWIYVINDWWEWTASGFTKTRKSRKKSKTRTERKWNVWIVIKLCRSRLILKAQYEKDRIADTLFACAYKLRAFNVTRIESGKPVISFFCDIDARFI